MTDQATSPVTEQLAGAIDMAQKLGGGALPAPAQKQRLPPGIRVQVAMMNAATNNCSCTPCRVLRSEAKGFSEMVIAELEDDAGSPDNQPG